MPYCGDTTLVKRQGGEHTARPLLCRSWQCSTCAPGRRKRLVAEVLGGQPNTLLTLTVRYDKDIHAAEQAKRLTRAWRCLRLALMRKYNLTKLPFMAVMEATKIGSPHLHITLRAPWMDQKFISAQMQRLIQSPIVDIRRIDRHRGIATYIAKYLGKGPKQFGTSKRYYKSKDWEQRPERLNRPPRDPSITFEILPTHFRTVVANWITFGYRVVIEGASFARARPP